MRIPVIRGLIKRRILANFRADPRVTQKLLPSVFRPKLQDGMAIVGVCLIRLEEIRPLGLPGFVGVASENAAHRMAVTWTGADGAEREGVYIARRDTGSWFNRLTGGRLFPGEHHKAFFSVAFENGDLDYRMRSSDGRASVLVKGAKAEGLPETSCFKDLGQASAFFQGGSLGYSVTKDPCRLDGLVLGTRNWLVTPLAVREIESSFYSDATRFPKGSIEFDHALLMQDVEHEWRGEKDMLLGSPAPI